MCIEISNGDPFELIATNRDYNNKSIKVGERFKRLAELLMSGKGLKIDKFKLQVILRSAYDLRTKDEEWWQKKKSFECDNHLKRNRAPSCNPLVLPPKCCRKNMTAGTQCHKVQSKILKNGLCSVASFTQEHGIEENVMLQKHAY